MNVFTIDKTPTMTMKGGNTDALYQEDGRLRMARSLERLWPGVVSVDRRFRRPQHVIKDSWRRFDTPLILKKGVVIQKTPNDYGMSLVEKTPIQSPVLREIYEKYHNIKQIRKMVPRKP